LTQKKRNFLFKGPHNDHLCTLWIPSFQQFLKKKKKTFKHFSLWFHVKAMIAILIFRSTQK